MIIVLFHVFQKKAFSVTSWSYSDFFFFISPSSRFCHFFPNISRNKSEIIPSHFILGGEDMIFFKGDYKTNWLVMVVIFCSVVVITSSRPQEQETTTTTFFIFQEKKGH